MTSFGVARLVAAKDLRIELRSRVLVNQVLPFAAIVMVLFAFALDSDDLLTRVAPGLVWLATLFSMLVIVQRSFAVEAADGALDALRIAGIPAHGIYLGKAIALAAQLLVLELLLFGGAFVLYNSRSSASGAALLITSALAASFGLGLVGTLYGGLTTGTKGRESLLPLLLLPVVAPVLIGATRATEAALGVGGISMREGWAWVALLVTYALLFGIGGSLGFGPLVDDGA
ncbi:MAG: heme exporter protein CcmB [Ilumatobacteraceae bacterium]|nr:heme exporter protein CcmB [Ilumatobacteraceae bacterium]